MSTKLDIEAIERRAEAATPGPWEPGSGEHWCREVRTNRRDGVAWCGAFGEEKARANAAFIAHARADVPALCARVRELEAEVAEVGGIRMSTLKAFAVKHDVMAPGEHANDCIGCLYGALADARTRAEQAESALREARAELEVLREVARCGQAEVDAFGGLPSDWDDEGVNLHDALARWDEFKKGRGGR